MWEEWGVFGGGGLGSFVTMIWVITLPRKYLRVWTFNSSSLSTPAISRAIGGGLLVSFGIKEPEEAAQGY